MSLDPTADQRLFQTTTRDFLAATVPLDTVRALAAPDAEFDRDWWRRGVELGWTTPLVPESLGGGAVSDAPLADLALIAEEFGRACAPGPLVTGNAALAGLLRSAGDFTRVIGEVVDGASIVVWAHYEPDAGFVARRVDTVATEAGAGLRLSGAKDRVEYGAEADLLLVDAQGPAGPVQVLVATDAPGVTITPTWTLDAVRHTATVTFDNVEISPEAVVHREPADAAAAVETQLLIASALSASEMTGATAHAFEVTVQWMFDRYSFGRPLASYQALKHRAADMATTLEACRATSWAAAHSFGSDPAASGGQPDTAAAVGTAKSFVGGSTGPIVQECVQLHGGLGVTWEHDMHLFLRRVTLGRALYGTPAEHRRRLTDLLEAS
ncbi:MAG: acyl-CoA/acyl-ACP dehydrogenase [Nocardia sp.]|nr:acyl-CoA/acyl-ACP dehydrogenase [Nocardia sp.]